MDGREMLCAFLQDINVGQTETRGKRQGIAANLKQASLQQLKCFTLSHGTLSGDDACLVKDPKNRQRFCTTDVAILRSSRSNAFSKVRILRRQILITLRFTRGIDYYRDTSSFRKFSG